MIKPNDKIPGVLIRGSEDHGVFATVRGDDVLKWGSQVRVAGFYENPEHINVVGEDENGTIVQLDISMRCLYSIKATWLSMKKRSAEVLTVERDDAIRIARSLNATLREMRK